MPDLNPEEREDLVAYLDGELDEKKAQDVETRMHSDATLRAEADALKQAWDLLDYLPRPEPNTSFTQRTMQRLNLHHGVSTQTMPSAPRPARRRLAAVWAAGLLLALAGGFWGGQLLAPAPTAPPDEALLRHLRVLELKHLYDRVEDLEELRALDHPDLFGDEPSGL